MKDSIRVYESTFTPTDKQIKEMEKIWNTNSVEVVHIDHMYISGGFTKDAPRKHACLQMGHWCWQNALENPLMAWKYITNSPLRRGK